MQVVKVYAGENLQVFQLQFVVNGKSYDLTASTLTAILRRTDLPAPTDANVTGALVVLGGVNGLFTWQPSAADVATAGVYELVPVSTVSGAPNKVSRGDPIFVPVLAQR